ncbi:MAG: RNB domain-containing ribonuclease [Cyanobacteriota bacterium]|nr:RNB domain-containing ribonuclease [Cyanobacteriota bacterium]
MGLPAKPGDDRPALLALVTNLQAGKADLRPIPSGKPISLPPRQLEVLVAAAEAGGSEPAQAARAFTADELACATPPRRDLAAAWQVMLASRSDDGEPLPLSLADFSDLVCGQSDAPHRCACWLWLQGAQTLFRLKQGQVQPRRGEELKRLRQERRRQRLLDDQRASWVAALKQRRPLSPDQLGERQQEELQRLRRWASGDRALPLSDDLKLLLQQVRCSPEPANVRHLLADVGLWPRHHLPSLQGTSWQLGFSDTLLAEAERLLALAEAERPGDEDRLDLTALHTITIDDDDTVDIDDGLSLEWLAADRPRIWVHVADPGRLVEAGSPLDLEARRRGTSLYLAQGTLPMFPEALAYGPFSLRAGLRCAAWSLGLELGADGALAALTLRRSWVRPAYRLSYGDADELLELAPPQERDLLTLHQLLCRRRAWRAARGALFLDQAEGRIRRDPTISEDDGARLEITEPTAARLLVAEAMILAGSAVAEFGQQHLLPLPYRGQPAAPVPSALELEALPAGPARMAAIKKGLTRGMVSTSAQPHFSLGLPAYVQATSPIRRYSDLLVQRQLARQLAGQAPLEAMELTDLLTTVELGVREGIAITREDQRHWQQVWFAAHKGQQWRGVFLRWLREDHHLALVHLEPLAIDLAADCRDNPQPGDPALVRVREVDPLRDLLRLEARAL